MVYLCEPTVGERRARQLGRPPVYNEKFVVERLLLASAALRPPAGATLRIQLLDDSSDETTAVAAAVVERLHGEGVDVVHVRRGSRDGYKAGALAEGLR